MNKWRTRKTSKRKEIIVSTKEMKNFIGAIWNKLKV